MLLWCSTDECLHQQRGRGGTRLSCSEDKVPEFTEKKDKNCRCQASIHSLVIGSVSATIRKLPSWNISAPFVLASHKKAHEAWWCVGWECRSVVYFTAHAALATFHRIRLQQYKR
ncbi:hypothetical protein Y032_0012g1838 [Ancylostoma ceylanicum]|uniref:Uncharacterized protein n=1 Tax=Ancylostoma ceylanicum TaxID=53326 RepID=A0A016VE82_9BILA|nr:hypothetical protein Y032_0012g1838 [Ancylostoma ceylanicum]